MKTTTNKNNYQTVRYEMYTKEEKGDSFPEEELISRSNDLDTICLSSGGIEIDIESPHYCKYPYPNDQIPDPFAVERKYLVGSAYVFHLCNPSIGERVTRVTYLSGDKPDELLSKLDKYYKEK